MTEFLLVSRDNNYGLTRDAAILRSAIGEKRTASVAARSRGLLDWLSGRKRAQTIVHLERAHARWFSAGTRNWLIPNQERLPKRQLGRLKRVARVLAKTRHAQAIFQALGVEAVYLGFTSEDRFDPGIEKDWSGFFHLAGASTLKGTEALLAIWAAHPEWPELVLVQKADNAPRSTPPNVRLISDYLDDSGLRRLQNECGVHLCPSRSEGWGHHIVEGLSVGAVVVTTDAPPMNEHLTAECGVLVAAAYSEPRHLGTNFFVDATALEAAVEALIALPDSRKARMGAAARDRYKAIDEAFRERVAVLFPAADGTGG